MTVHTPIETRSNRLPPWAILLTLLVLLVGGVYLVSNLGGENPAFAIPGASAAPPASGAPGVADPAVGEQLISQATPQCTACHGPDLGGSGAFPSLHDVENGPVSENLQDLAAANPDTWIGLWINGTTPETEGIDRMGMPMYGEQFSQQQIDSIVAYLLSLP